MEDCSCTQITGLDARPRKAEAIECSVLAVRRVKALQGWPAFISTHGVARVLTWKEKGRRMALNPRS